MFGRQLLLSWYTNFPIISVRTRMCWTLIIQLAGLQVRAAQSDLELIINIFQNYVPGRCNQTLHYGAGLYHPYTNGFIKFWRWYYTIISFFTGKHRRLVNVSDLATELGKQWCSTLLGFYVFTGEDCTSTFKGKGKIAPLKKLIKSPMFHNAFRYSYFDLL